MKTKAVLAIYPNGRGFAYVCFENGHRLIGFGNAIANPICNEKLLLRLSKLLKKYQPELVLLPKGKHGNRIKELLVDVQQFLKKEKYKFIEYSREEIQFVFQQFEAKSKYEIAIELIKLFPELGNRMPAKRKAFTSYDYNMGVFDAMSLVVTYKYLEVI